MAGRQQIIKGRGTAHNPANRFHEQHREDFDDGLGFLAG